MSDRAFVDTNVLVYAIAREGQEAKKSEKAKALLQFSNLCLSTQVLGEFYRAVTSSRRQTPLSSQQAIAWVQLWKRFEVQPITVPHVDLALDICGRFQIGYFDALIISAARLATCNKVYSEDLNDGQDYARVRVENPFRNL